MENIIISIVVLFSGYVQPGQYESRFDQESYNKMQKLYPIVRQVQHNTNIPPHIILGTIYNESQGNEKAIGDGGLSLGLGQVRCFWLGEVAAHPLFEGMTCRETLLRPEWNVYVVGEVLKHLKGRYKREWRATTKLYHLGPAGLGSVDDSAYQNRTEYFGRYFVLRYNAWKMLNDIGIIGW